MRLPVAKHRWQVSSGTPVAGKEDYDVYTDFALQAIESWEDGVKGPLWVRPSCDGMVIRVGQNPGDDIYE